MGRIFVLFVVSVVATTAHALADVNLLSEKQNNIDVFSLKPVNNQFHTDKSARAFYYPGRTFENQMEHVAPLNFRGVFERPVLVITPSPNVPNTFSMFYLHSGLGSLHRYHAFASLQEFFKHPGLKGLIFYPHIIYNQRFSDTPLSSITVQDDLRTSDFINAGNCNRMIPYVFVAPEDFFDQMKFENLVKVSNFMVYNDTIEVRPIGADSPLDLQFDGSEHPHKGGKALDGPSTGSGRSGRVSTVGSKSETGTQSHGHTQKVEHSDLYPTRTFLLERGHVRSDTDKVVINHRQAGEVGAKTGHEGNYKSKPDRNHPQQGSYIRFDYDSRENQGGVSQGHADVDPNEDVGLASDSDTVQSATPTQGGIIGAVGSFVRTGAGIVGNVASGLVKRVQTGAELVEDVAEGAVMTGAAFVKSGTHFVGNVGTTVVKTGAEIVRTGAEIAEGVGNGIVNAGTGVVEKGADIAENVGVGVVHVGAEVVRTGTGVVTDVGTGLIRTGAEIVGTVSSDLVEKGTRIVGDVAKIVRTNLNATAHNVRNEFNRHHVHERLEEPRQ